MRAFDDACLASSLAWEYQGAAASPSVEPAAFRRRANSDGSDGILGAVVLIQYRADGDEWKHLCGGLLLPPERSGQPVRVLTALHCFAGHTMQTKLNAPGRDQIRVVRAGGDFSQWAPEPSQASKRIVGSVADDHLLLDLPSAPRDLKIPRVRFASPGDYDPVVALGYFIHHDPSRIPAGIADVSGASRIPTFRRGLRWSPVCVAVGAGADCVRLLCQTESGFSGTPIFAETPDEDGVLVVHGIVSRADGAGPACAASSALDLRNLRSTVASLPSSLFS